MCFQEEVKTEFELSQDKELLIQVLLGRISYPLALSWGFVCGIVLLGLFF